MVSLIYIQGMKEDENAKDVAIALRKLDGIATVYVSFNEAHARVEYDENRISLDKITEEISRMGFKPGIHEE